MRVAWMAVNRLLFAAWFPWPSKLKRAVLRLFGARVGRGVVIKNLVNIKYPWNLSLGDHCWIGEGVWIDSVGFVRIGANVCLSQGCMIETGNHDWTRSSFDLVVRDVVVEDGAWAAVRSLLLPGSTLATHAVLGAASVLSGSTEPYSVYVGVPARKTGNRLIEGEAMTASPM
jgi:putative colanic acid biosynthesis acetyltransferase WcaF